MAGAVAEGWAESESVANSAIWDTWRRHLNLLNLPGLIDLLA